MKQNENRKYSVSIPVQCTILVPIDFQVDDDIQSAIDESVDGFDFVSLDKLPDGASVAVELVRQAMGNNDVKEALSAFAIAVSVYRENYPNHIIKISPYAGIVSESDI